MLGLAAGLQPGHRRSYIPQRGRVFNTIVLLRAVFFASYLSSSSTIKEALREAALVLVPKALHRAIPGLITGNMVAPTKSTLSRALLSLEIAMILRVRRENRDVVRFGWADSSTKKGYDLLLSAHGEILRIHLRLCL